MAPTTNPVAPCGLPIVNLYDQVLQVGTYLAHWANPAHPHLVHVRATAWCPNNGTPTEVVVCMEDSSMAWPVGPNEMLSDPVRVLTDPYCAAVNATNPDDFDSGVAEGKYLHIAGPQEPA